MTDCSVVTVLALVGLTKKRFGHYAILKNLSLRSPSKFPDVRMSSSNITLKAAMPSFYDVAGSSKALGSLFLHIPNWYGKQWISTLTTGTKSTYVCAFQIIKL